METSQSILIIYALLPSLLATFILPLFKNKPNLRDITTVIATLITFVFVVVIILPIILSGEKLSFVLFEILPGMSVAFKVDAFGMVFAVVTASLWVMTNIYGIGYMRGLNEHAQTRFFVYFTISIFAALGVAFSGNLLTLFIFYEILSIVTYPLVIHHEDVKSMRSGTEYMIYLIVFSFLFQLIAILLIYGIAGTLEYTDGGILSLSNAGALMLTAIFLMLIFGYAKCAIFPVHSWLPAAMVAPTPVSALLHAVAVVVAGVFGVLRMVFDVFGPQLIHSLNLHWVLGTLAAFTIIATLLFGLTQDHFKRRIAYSTVTHLSVMMLGAALLTKAGMIGGILHIAAHSFGKIVLFFTAGAVFVATHKEYIKDLNGMGWKMPITFISFTIGVLAMIGIPLTFASLSKGMMMEGALAGEYFIFFAVFLLAGLLDVFYFFPIIYRAFFKEPYSEDKNLKINEFSPKMSLVVVPTAIVAAFVVIFFFIHYPFFGLAEMKVEYINPVKDVIEMDFAEEWTKITEYGLLIIIAIFLIANYRYFGKSKGKEIIRFDTPYIYGGNILSRTCRKANNEILKFYSYWVNVSHIPDAWFVSKIFGEDLEKGKKIVNVSAYDSINFSTLALVLFLIVAIIVGFSIV